MPWRGGVGETKGKIVAAQSYAILGAEGKIVVAHFDHLLEESGGVARRGGLHIMGDRTEQIAYVGADGEAVEGRPDTPR